MAARTSAGILLHRLGSGGTEVLLAHMGGPFWARKEEGAWTLPKGEPGPGEDLLAAARREFAEELGVAVPTGEAVPLGSVRQSGGKVVSAWAVAGDLDPGAVVPGTFLLEWPPRSGRMQEVPEVDRVAWCDLATARRLLVRAQVAFVDRLEDLLGPH